MSQKRIISIVVFLLLFGIIGCASYKHSKVDVLTVEEYPIHTNVEGISFAADTFDTSEEAIQVFYEDVTSEGFYPVLVVVHNNTNDRLIIQRGAVKLIDAHHNIYRPVRSVVMSDTCEHNKMTYAILGFGIFSYMSAEEANEKMASDWRDKELPEQVIIPAGLKKHGFLYFQLPEGLTTEGCKLTIDVEKLETNENLTLELIL